MTSAVNPLVLNNGAGTPVAKNFDLISPAAGDGGVAKWVLKEGTIASVFPTVTAVARPSGNRATDRRVQVKLRLPSSYTDTVTGLTKVGSAFEFDGYATIPADFPESLKNDAVAFAKNLIAHAMVQAMFKDGSSAS